MPNPIFDNPLASQPQPQSGLMGLFNAVRNSPNPNEAAAGLLTPELRTYISQNGGDAKTAFYNMAAQKGIDPNRFLSTLKTFM